MYEKARSHARAARRASFGTEREMRKIQSRLSVGGLGQIGQINVLKDATHSLLSIAKLRPFTSLAVA
jgi:hypothetical protein